MNYYSLKGCTIAHAHPLIPPFGYPGPVWVLRATIGDLVRIMSPVRTPEQITGLNKAVEEIYLLTERHLVNKRIAEMTSTPVVCVGNLIGLFIQSYDAGRGILGNSLLQLLLQGELSESTFEQKTITFRNLFLHLRH